MTTGKAIALNIRIFVGKVMVLFLNTLFQLVITFLPRSKHTLISLLHSIGGSPVEVRCDYGSLWGHGQ